MTIMTLTIAHWKFVIQVRPTSTTPAADPAQALARYVERRRLDVAIGRTRQAAQARWMVLGGAQVR